MGLRYRKSVTLFPGVRLNFGKTGMSISAGVPGFRKTFHTSGKVTTSVGIPGTGLYYIDTKDASSSYRNTYQRANMQTSDPEQSYSRIISYDRENLTYEPTVTQTTSTTKQVDEETIKRIHKSCDDSVDWTEVLVYAEPPEAGVNTELWSYYHNIAPDVLAGNIDAYLQVIYEINPLDDLLDYAGSFEFGTDNANYIEVEFRINESPLNQIRCDHDVERYNDILQDYVCSICIRIARDLFALLPIKFVLVHAVLNDATIISVKFDRTSLSKVRFGFIDSSSTIMQFEHKMEFNNYHGFRDIKRVEI